MNASRMILIAAAALVPCTAVYGQATRVDRAFSATGTNCEDVTWSAETLESYPNIASACREVLERDGKYFVRFEGEVDRVADGGRRITVDFEEGDRLTLTPPENLAIYIDGRRRSPRELQPGDQLNFYVPQDQLVATFFAGEPQTAPAEEAPIAPEPEDQFAAADYQDEDMLPGTASALPLLGFAGLLFVGLASVLTFRRRTRN